MKRVRPSLGKGILLSLTLVAMLVLTSITVLGAPGDPGTPSDTLLFDVLIKGGTIVDGTGNAAFIGDVGIVGDTIKAVGKISDNAKAAKVIDATGKYVMPGFIDLHTHADGAILTERYAENYVRQGTTTVTAGMCGGGQHPVGEFLAKLNQGGTGPNVVMLVGHGDIREAVIGMADRKTTPEELGKMKGMVKQAMEEGAYGLSSGLMYTPGYYADVNELAELCKVVAAYDGFYTSHIREQSYDVVKSWQEIIDTGKLSGARVNIAHAKVIGKSYWGTSKQLIQMLADAQAAGIKATSDAYPYEAGSTSVVGALIPQWAQADSYDAMKARLHDPALAEQLHKEIMDLLELRGGTHAVLITNFKGALTMEKKYLDEIMAAWGMTDPVAAIIKIVDLGNASGVFFHASLEDQETFYKSPYMAVGSDANDEFVGRIKGTLTHPRAYGTMPKYLSMYVRDGKIMTLEEGVRKMTSLPASVIGLHDRGVIQKGMKADVAVVDLPKVKANSTYLAPHQFPDGIETVIINGKAAVEVGKFQQILSGRGLIRGQN